MNELRNAAQGEASTTTTITSLAGYSKDNKQVATPVESRVIQRWGMWMDATGYFDGRHIAAGSLGIDYRLKPHWLIGAYGNFYYARHGVFQGGLYTAWYEKNWWGVLGGQLGFNDYDAFASTGYDWNFGKLILGPVVSLQYDNQTTDHGLGKGQLLQERAGIRAAMALGRLFPEVQVMYQHQDLDVAPGRFNALWASVGSSYLISDSWSIYAIGAFEGSDRYQIWQPTLGVRFQF